LLQNVLDEALLGVYLYGSAVVGGLRTFSDIDIFVVSGRVTTREEKSKLVSSLLEISGVYQRTAKRPIELLIVTHSQINPWTYPSSFDFQYGDWLRKEFEKGNIEPWPSKVMPDLALLITQVMLASKTLVGRAPDKLLPKVPYKDILSATEVSLTELASNLTCDTRNILLTYARIWAMLTTDSIWPKPEAALWAMEQLPIGHKEVMARARSICIGEQAEYWEDMVPQVHRCVDFMEAKIRERFKAAIFIDGPLLLI
jgi:streptomycin 3"-adenylyltransferase